MTWSKQQGSQETIVSRNTHKNLTNYSNRTQYLYAKFIRVSQSNSCLPTSVSLQLLMLILLKSG